MEKEVDYEKIQNTKDFYDFLKDENVFADFKYRDNGKIFLVKAPFNSKIDILYSTHSYNGEVFDLHSELEYSGFYDKVNDKLYDLGFTIRFNILDYETTKDIADKTGLYEKISQEVGNRVKELVSEEREELFGKSYEIPEIKDYEIPKERDANIHFIDGLTSETYQDDFPNYHTEKSKNILDYITDPETFVEEESREYILDHLDDIYIGLYQSEEKRKLLKEIEEDKTKPIHKIKDIIDSIRDQDYKTVNLTINKDGIEQTFKYERDPLLWGYNHSYLSTYNFVSAKERAEFEENFGRNTDLHYEDIIKITYGKNIVYEDENFKNIEEDLCL